MKTGRILLILTVGVISAGLVLTMPRPLPDSATDGLTGFADEGALVFHAAGCASCHTAPEASVSDRPELAGGQRFPSDFGTFIAPNISPDPTHGIGGWSTANLANALMRGLSPEGQHYYPAFPYPAYTRMTMQDVADLKAFLDTLPAVTSPSQPHEVGFPFNIRRGLGLWKLLLLDHTWISQTTNERGRYLVEALAHCGECHTPRNALGGLRRAAWLTGAPDPSGKGKVPGITPDQLDWSEDDIAYYLSSGFTPDFDSVGGHMVHVVKNMAKLPDADRTAIALYLKSLP